MCEWMRKTKNEYMLAKLIVVLDWKLIENWSLFVLMDGVHFTCKCNPVKLCPFLMLVYFQLSSWKAEINSNWHQTLIRKKAIEILTVPDRAFLFFSRVQYSGVFLWKACYISVIYYVMYTDALVRYVHRHSCALPRLVRRSSTTIVVGR